jgi:nucleoside phosphorylase
MNPPRPSGRSDFQIAIICALPIEAAAVLHLCDHLYSNEGLDLGVASGDRNLYIIATMSRHNIVVVILPEMGTTSASTAAATLHMSYPNLRMAFVVGICAGIPSVGSRGLYLGDVVISTAVVQYDSGRQFHESFVVRDTLEDSKGRPAREVRSLLAHLKVPPLKKQLLVQAAAHLERLQEKAVTEEPETDYQEPPEGSDKCYPADLLHKHHPTSRLGECAQCAKVNEVCPKATKDSCEDCGCPAAATTAPQPCRVGDSHRPLQIVLGRIGSANMVLKSSLDRDRLAKDHDLVAFEMEVAGVWDEVPTLMVKGVCDYADSHKNKLWQTYAAARAAAVTRALIEKLHLDDQPNASSGAATPNSQATERDSSERRSPGSRTMSNITIGNGGVANQGDISGGFWHR